MADKSKSQHTSSPPRRDGAPLWSRLGERRAAFSLFRPAPAPDRRG